MITLLNRFVNVKKERYKQQFLDKYHVVSREIPDEVKTYCKYASDHMMAERTFETLDGGGDFVYRGNIVQEMTHLWLGDYPHEYMRPYTPGGRPKDEFDIKIGDETFDTKGRGFWNDESPQFTEFLITQREYDQRERLKSDYYIFGCTDYGEGPFKRNKCYIIGGLSYYDLWDRVQPKKELKANGEKREYRIPTYGYLYAKDLDTLDEIVFRVRR